jgi:hypothetical protein
MADLRERDLDAGEQAVELARETAVARVGLVQAIVKEELAAMTGAPSMVSGAVGAQPPRGGGAKRTVTTTLRTRYAPRTPSSEVSRVISAPNADAGPAATSVAMPLASSSAADARA